jgi:hypothetical protein
MFVTRAVHEAVQLCRFAAKVTNDDELYAELLLAATPKPPRPRVVCIKTTVLPVVLYGCETWF